MDDAWMDLLVEVRARVAVLAGLVLSTVGCEREGSSTCDLDETQDCLVDTTTTGMEVPWNFGDDAADDESYQRAVVECVPLQDGECPATDLPCLAELMQGRDGYDPCVCGLQEGFSEILAGPDPAVTDACCFTIHLETSECFAGRPFFVDGAARVAMTDVRGDWTGDIDVRSIALDPRAGALWLARARSEHASIAAFARAIVQLLALGAPADLVAGTQRALADEIRHAQVCFAIASALLGTPVGPGPLSLVDASLDTSVEAFAHDVLVGGCLGEMTAAAGLHREARYTTSPRLRGALERIAADETQHAALAFSTIRWLAQAPSTAARSQAAVRRFTAETLTDHASRVAVEPLLRAAIARDEIDRSASAGL